MIFTYRQFHNLLGLNASILCIALSNIAHAQDVAETLIKEVAPDEGLPADPAPDAGREIVVTAQGREQRLQDVPLSATVVSGASLEKANIRDLHDLSSHVANVRIASAPAAELLNIRGVGSGLNGTFEQSAGTFVDGVYRGRSRSARAALFDVDRVEVLKGPQTTFFGNNAIAGALNITTRTPGDYFDYNASILRGSDGEYAYEAGLTVPIDDAFSARIAGKAYGMDGYIKNDLTGGKGSHQRDWIGRISLVWQPTENFHSDLRLDRGRLRDDDAYPSQIVNCAPDTPTDNGLCAQYLAQDGDAADGKLDQHRTGIPSDYDYDFIEIAWRNELDLGGATLKSLTSHFDHDVYQTNSLFPLPLNGVAGTGLLLGGGSPESYKSFSQEIRLESASDGPVTYTLGAYFSQGKLRLGSAFGLYFAPLGAALTELGYNAASPLTSNTDFRQKDTSLSAFGALTWRASERLRINASLRYSTVAKEASRHVISGITDGSTLFPHADTIIAGTPEQQAAINTLLAIDGAPFVDGDRRDNKLMPGFGLQYDLADRVMAYASYTRGFKAGGFSSSSSINLFGPETVDAYEAGLKSSLLDNRATLNISAFWNDFNDLQEASNFLLPNGSTLSLIQNAAKARVRGVELGGILRFAPGITFNADIAYLDARYRDFPNGPCTPSQVLAIPNCQQDLSGARRAFAPEFSGNVGLDIAAPLAGGTLNFAPNLFFTSKYGQQVNGDPIFYQSGYAKLDARLAYARDNWELALIGKNLADKTTASFRNALQNFGSVFALVDRGRSVAVQFSIRR